MKFRVHKINLEDFDHFSREDLIEQSRRSEKEVRRFLGLKWDIEGVESEIIEEQIDQNYDT